MRKTNVSSRIGRQLTSVDPGHSVSASELARSRERSVAFLNSDSDAKAGVESRIDTHAQSHTSLKVSPIRFRRRVLFASAAAALLVGGIVVADVVPIGGNPGATAEAAEVLDSAATATIQTSDPVVGPGQYLKIETKATGVSGGVTAAGEQYLWLGTSGSQTYIPADKNAEWVFHRDLRVPTTYLSELARAEVERARIASPQAPEGTTYRAVNGAFGATEQTLLNGMPLEEAITTLPRDAKSLLDLIYERTKGRGESPDVEAFISIADTLRSGLIPADLRAALYKAGAFIPGVAVMDRQAVLDGRTGIAIGIKSAGGTSRQDIIIDPQTGLMIGERHVALKDTAEFPAGTSESSTSIQTSVVNTAP